MFLLNISENISTCEKRGAHKNKQNSAVNIVQHFAEMGILNRHQLKIAQSCLAFIIGSQIVHAYLNPLKDIDKLVAEKKSKLWQEYLEKNAPENKSS